MVGDATTHHMWSDYGVSGSYGKLLAGAPLLHVPIVSDGTPPCREHSRNDEGYFRSSRLRSRKKETSGRLKLYTSIVSEVVTAKGDM